MTDLAEAARRADRDRFLATLLAPMAKRPALWALLAFNHEIARVREAVTQPILGQIRLQWWRDALAEIYEGRAVRRHFVATPLAAAIQESSIGRAHLDAMVDAREHDLDEAPPATLADLETYAEGSAGRLNMAMLDVLGGVTPAAVETARHVGIAWALTGLARAIPFHARARRLYLPTDIMRDCGLSAETVFALRPGPEVAAAVARLADAAHAHLAAARRLRAKVPRAALPVLLPARIADAYLGALSRAGYDPYAAPVQQADPLAAARLWWGMRIRRY